MVDACTSRLHVAAVALALALSVLATGCTGPNPAFRPLSETTPGPVVPGTGGTAGATPDAPTLDMQTVARFDLSTDLLAYFTFDEAGGTTVLDRSGHGNHATLENLDAATARDASGRGHSLAMPATAINPGVRVNTLSPAVRELDAFTIAAWAYRESAVAGVENAVLSRQLGTSARQVWNLSFNGSSLSVIMSQEQSSSPFSLGANVEAPLGVWLHVAATFDGNVLRLYQNGALVGEARRSFALARSDNPIYIGTNKNVDHDEPMIGKLDDVLLYGVALPAETIMALAGGAVPPER